MKILLKEHEDIFGMANIVPKRSGLSVDIWSEHKVCIRNVKHNIPRAKISIGNIDVSISIEKNPQILNQSCNMKKSEERAVKAGIRYVGRNYDLFLKHYMDLDDSFDDEDLFNALRERGEYK